MWLAFSLCWGSLGTTCAEFPRSAYVSLVLCQVWWGCRKALGHPHTTGVRKQYRIKRPHQPICTGMDKVHRAQRKVTWIPLLCCVALTWWSLHPLQFRDLQKLLDWMIHCTAWRVLSKELLAVNECGYCCCFFGLGIQVSCTGHKTPYLPALHLRCVTK